MNRRANLQHLLDRLQCPDVYRSFFYLEAIESSFQKLLSVLEHNLVEIDALIPFFKSLMDFADRSIAPIFAFEVAFARQTGLLKGETPHARYRSFFLDINGWTFNFKRVRTKYRYMQIALANAIEGSIDNLIECINNFQADRTDLIRFSINESNASRIKGITLLSADRHRGGKQPILLELCSGVKVVYKPTNLIPDVLFGYFIDQLELPKPYDLKYARVLAKDGYGWIEFITYQSCAKVSEIQDYYRRAGVLVAVADFLNYTDGHVENLIASGSYPVLIDVETLLQPMSAWISRADRSVLFTQLVQKIPEDLSGFRYNAAIQAPSKRRVHSVFPYVQDDQTDDLRVRFQGVPAPATQNNPICNGQIHLPRDYVDFVVEGYRFGFDYISSRLDKIFSPKWWSMLSCSRPRFIVRPTVYYAMLIRLIQQPRNCLDATYIEQFLSQKLSEAPISLDKFVDYEISDLMRFEIPYFYHIPSLRSIFDGRSKEYDFFFSESAVKHLMRNAVEFNKSYRDRSAYILQTEIERADQIFSRSKGGSV